MTGSQPDRAADLPTVDLSECENEPIHLLELVQSHGCILLLAGEPLTVIQASNNTDRFLGRTAEQILGQPVEGLLDDLAADLLLDLMTEGGVRTSEGHPFGLYARSTVTGRRSQRLRGLARRIEHAGQPCLILELEHCPESDEDDAEHTYEAEGFAMAALTESENLYKLLDQAVHAIAGLTDYDRVMAYMFHPDWSGEVVAESFSGDLTPFLGLRYPASDIPSQARDLYLSNRLRVIADVGSVSVPMLRGAPSVAEEAPLDLGQAVLRSVSSYHIEYLRNMGVAATLVTSLVVDGRLWGLIACHNYSPKMLPWHRREAMDRLSIRISERIGDILTIQRSRQKRRKRRFLDLIGAAQRQTGNALETLFFGAPRLADVVRCDGLAVCAPGRVAATGNTPAPGDLRAFLERVAMLAEDGLFVSDALSAAGGFEDVLPAGCCGALVVIVSRDPLVALACFRDEVVQEVHWGGDPNKPVEVDAASQRLSPRKSFNLWREEVRGHARPWEDWTIDLFRDLAEVLTESLPGRDKRDRAALWAEAVDALMAGFERRAPTILEGLDLADNGALLAVPGPDGSRGRAGVPRDVALAANAAFCVQFDVDHADILGRPVVDVLVAMGLPTGLVDLPQGGVQEVEWWSGTAGHRTLQVVRRGLFAVDRDGESRAWGVFTFDDVTNMYRTQRALTAARAQALARARGRTEFLGQLARELRVPLHAIQGFAESLETGDQAVIADRFREYAGEIRALSGSLMDLLNELLDVARLETGGDPGSAGVFDLTLLVGEVCRALRQSGRDRNVSWDWHLPNERILIQGDEGAIRHALSTLIGAALRASPASGSVMVRVTMERGGEPRVSVSDSGLGLGEDDLMALQRPLDAAVSHAGGSLEPRRGLGLSLVRALIDLHGGGVSVTSNPGSGTTVHITLPRHRVAGRDNAPAKAKKNASDS
ncbi:ATP-binding protein [Roseospira navarrensis]|uniref:histidine kinase n=1 Tax=Roseospira navarrensis TaxID=140058 RepID=A0A7X1ZCF5_9PROT|nr:ATP-binding protein [Roseospira navarrensis]MQX35763.1 GAF domain-containing protein [Roseospira navarrensis]